MYEIYNLTATDNVEVIEAAGPFIVLAHRYNLNAKKQDASKAFYNARLAHKTRQLICSLEKDDVIIAEGMMQWMVGTVEMVSGASNVFSYMGKLFKGKITGQKAIAPRYSGVGTIALEPVNQEILLIDLEQWPEGLVIESDMFLAASGGVERSVIARSNLSSAMFGNEGIFNMVLRGKGIAAILSPAVREQLLVIQLEDDVLQIDGHFAFAWSAGLDFRVENAGDSVMSAVISKEGMVNTYRGTGRVLMVPFEMRPSANQGDGKQE